MSGSKSGVAKSILLSFFYVGMIGSKESKQSQEALTDGKEAEGLEIPWYIS